MANYDDDYEPDEGRGEYDRYEDIYMMYPNGMVTTNR